MKGEQLTVTLGMAQQAQEPINVRPLESLLLPVQAEAAEDGAVQQGRHGRRQLVAEEVAMSVELIDARARGREVLVGVGGFWGLGHEPGRDVGEGFWRRDGWGTWVGDE
jgi:hypothetical protein